MRHRSCARAGDRKRGAVTGSRGPSVFEPWVSFHRGGRYPCVAIGLAEISHIPPHSSCCEDRSYSICCTYAGVGIKPSRLHPPTPCATLEQLAAYPATPSKSVLHTQRGTYPRDEMKP
eukprot:13932-Heterococcus_DN1.PRE.4